jgi:hypothetical protein
LTERRREIRKSIEPERGIHENKVKLALHMLKIPEHFCRLERTPRLTAKGFNVF